MPILNVTISKVAYPPATSDTDWYILITSRNGACKGKMAWRPKEGDTLALDGEWSTYRGQREFAFKSASLDVPTNAKDQLHYVCTRTVGLGPAMESLIWSAAGDDWPNIEPGQVPRMTGKIFEEFKLQVGSLESDQEHVKTVAWLMGKGATMNMASAAWEKWEAEAIGVVSDDCYRLSELGGYGFHDVDKVIRVSFEIGDDDDRRIRACVVYSLRRLTDNGSTIVTWEDLLKKACGTLGGYDALVVEATKVLFAEQALKGFSDSQSVSLSADFYAERDILMYVDNEVIGTTESESE
jgi:hypothetical protein